MSEKKIKLKAIKVGFLGDSDVGKTAICNSLLKNEFTAQNISTIGSDKMEAKIKLKDGKDIKLILWDTAGQERFRSIALSALKVVQGIAIVFDVTKKDSFNSVEMWLEKIRENFNNPTLILLGNKVDLPKEKWEVTEEKVEEFIKKNNITYFNTSAKTGFGINESFSHIANEIYDKYLDKKEDNIKINKQQKKKEESGGCFFSRKKNKKTEN